MNARRLLYLGLAVAGAICLFCGLKVHRHIASDGTAETESLTVGLAGSPLFTRLKEPGPSTKAAETSTESGHFSITHTESIQSAWHPVSGSALLAVLGLALLFGAGRLRKAG